MPKYRKLYTKTVESLDVNDMPDDFTRLFWVLLPLALCREGRGLDNAAWLKSKLFPLREDVTQGKVYSAFQWCCNRGMIQPYEVGGRGYFQVPTFHQYQGDTRKEAESDYPAPLVQTYSGPTPELVQSKSSTDSYSDADAYSDADTDAIEREQVAPPANSSSEKRASKPKTKEPAPVAVEKFREVTLRYPNKALWADIQSVIGSDEKELARWQRTVKAWIAMGWNPTNVKGMLQHFRDKRIPGDDMKSRGSPGGIPEPAGYAALRALAQEEGWEGFDTTWQH